MKLTKDAFETIRPSEESAVQAEVIYPTNLKSTGTGLSIGKPVKKIAVLSFMAIILAIAGVSMVSQPRSEAAPKDISAGMELDGTVMPYDQRTCPDLTQAPLFLPSPYSCCATIVAEISMR